MKNYLFSGTLFLFLSIVAVSCSKESNESSSNSSSNSDAQTPSAVQTKVEYDYNKVKTSKNASLSGAVFYSFEYNSANQTSVFIGKENLIALGGSFTVNIEKYKAPMGVLVANVNNNSQFKAPSTGLSNRMVELIADNSGNYSNAPELFVSKLTSLTSPQVYIKDLVRITSLLNISITNSPADIVSASVRVRGVGTAFRYDMNSIEASGYGGKGEVVVPMQLTVNNTLKGSVFTLPSCFNVEMNLVIETTDGVRTYPLSIGKLSLDANRNYEIVTAVGSAYQSKITVSNVETTDPSMSITDWEDGGVIDL